MIRSSRFVVEFEEPYDNPRILQDAVIEAMLANHIAGKVSVRASSLEVKEVFGNAHENLSWWREVVAPDNWRVETCGGVV
jgi:hypothetical protein